MTSTPPSQRQAASRAKKKADGFVRLTLRFNAKTAARLRRMAKKNKTTQAQAIDAALVLMESADPERINIAVEPEVAQVLEQIASENQRSAAKVIELGILVARRELDAIAARKTAHRKAEQVE